MTLIPADDPRLQAVAELVAIVARLRDPQAGCPWDLAQTHESLIPYAIEEAYEVAAAIRSGEPGAIAEELGDLLLQVVLHAQIASETTEFDLTDVARGIGEKLVRRHPHVFDADSTAVADVEEVRRNWEAIKAAEKGESTAEAQRLSRKLAKYATSLPPLLASLKISRKAVEVGFEWESAAGVWEKFAEELGEFQEALEGSDRAHQEAELGDLLFTVVNIARWHGLDPEAALQGTNQRFAQRLQGMEDLADRPLEEYNLAELEALWQQAKRQLAATAVAATNPDPTPAPPPTARPPKSADGP